MAMGSVTRTKKEELKEALSHLTGLQNRKPDNQYSINVTISDETSLDRELPDTRPPVCATLRYDSANLPKCSVIIPFFNEAPTMILRTIHSVLNRSPAHLLEEIILGLQLRSLLLRPHDVRRHAFMFCLCPFFLSFCLIIRTTKAQPSHPAKVGLYRMFGPRLN